MALAMNASAIITSLKVDAYNALILIAIAALQTTA